MFFLLNDADNIYFSFIYCYCSAPDLTKRHLSHLNEFVFQLVCSGQLVFAKVLRIKILEKVRVDNFHFPITY